MQSPFFALLHRLRSTARWSGMIPLQPEDVAQHTYGVTVIAHALCIIDQTLYERTPPTEAVLTAALYHDAAECILTDVIAPVKKYSPQVEAAFGALERIAEEQLFGTLPEPLQPVYAAVRDRHEGLIGDYVHAADKLDALCKCKQELRRGNQEFALAAQQIEKSVMEYAERLPSVAYFLNTFIPAFLHSVDEYRYLK